MHIFTPLDVPLSKKIVYNENYNTLTRGTGKAFVFAADQKIEHLNDDFYGHGIDPEASSVEHIFRIASQGSIGALATSAGLIAQYAYKFPAINYIVKLNSKTNLVDPINDPISTLLWSVSDVVKLKNNTQLPILGVGYTLYLGSCHEHIMMHQAAQVIKEAHEEGLLVILWVYPRAKHIDISNKLIAGSCGVANALGADFVKVQVHGSMPSSSTMELLRIAVQAAGSTGVICAGGEKADVMSLLANMYDQMHSASTAGCAIGRNIFQRSTPQAVSLTRAIAAIVYEDALVEQAVKMCDF